MIKNHHRTLSALLFGLATALPVAGVRAQEGEKPQEPQPSFEKVATGIEQRLEQALAELSAQRKEIGDERIPLAERRAERETVLLGKRKEYDDVARTLATRSQDLNNLTKTVEALRAQSNYLGNLLRDYKQQFESRLHIVELQRYADQLGEARLTLENTELPQKARFETLLGLVDTSLDKLEDALGGARFTGATVANDVQKQGTFVVVGPQAMFRSADGKDIGLVEERAGSQEPSLVPFTRPEDRDEAAKLALGTGGSFPLDVTLGNAQKVESINETWWEHVQKGGVIMIPMAVLAGAALLVVLLKWLSMMFVRRPGKKQMEQLLECVDEGDYQAAVECAATMPGPAGRMLEAGASHLGEPRDMVEEVMFEKMLSARLRLNGWLPFVAICATSAPLLGLLGTVTGIMGTFALMTEFGTGDPKVLSSGISEALITTEHGLIIAIPSLLLHAFLARKAKGIVDGMEKMALQLMNRVHAPDAVESADNSDAVGVA